MRQHECGSEQGPELGPPASDSNVSVTGDGDGTPPHRWLRVKGANTSKALGTLPGTRLPLLGTIAICRDRQEKASVPRRAVGLEQD